MKKIVNTVLAAIMVFMCMTQYAAAGDISTYASDYLDSYGSRMAYVSGRSMRLTYWVYGTTTMDKVGAEELTIWEDDGDGWRIFASYSDLYTYNDSEHFDTISFQGQNGCSYMATITAYAKLGSGYDTRTFDSPTTQCPI